MLSPNAFALPVLPNAILLDQVADLTAGSLLFRLSSQPGLEFQNSCSEAESLGLPADLNTLLGWALIHTSVRLEQPERALELAVLAPAPVQTRRETPWGWQNGF